MRFVQRSHGQHVAPVEITPMIDVVFLLIIFFMTTARFAQDTRAELDLPQEQGEQQESADEAGLILNIEASGAIIVGTRPVEIGELEEIVQEEICALPGRDPEQLKLMIRADRNCDTGRLNAVISRLQQIGVGAARVATEIP